MIKLKHPKFQIEIIAQVESLALFVNSHQSAAFGQIVCWFRAFSNVFASKLRLSKSNRFLESNLNQRIKRDQRRNLWKSPEQIWVRAL